MKITECNQPNSKRPAMVFDSKEEVVTAFKKEFHMIKKKNISNCISRKSRNEECRNEECDISQYCYIKQSI